MSRVMANAPRGGDQPQPDRHGWRSMESAPIGRCVDLWVYSRGRGYKGERWINCFQDGHHLSWRNERFEPIDRRDVTHWRFPPPPPEDS